MASVVWVKFLTSTKVHELWAHCTSEPLLELHHLLLNSYNSSSWQLIAPHFCNSSSWQLVAPHACKYASLQPVAPYFCNSSFWQPVAETTIITRQ